MVRLAKTLLQNAGKRKKRGRVVGGTTVRSNTEFPEYGGIKTSGNSHFCGSTILDSNHILTAAHCQVNAGQDKVIVGTVERSGAGGTHHVLEKCTRHPDAKGNGVWDSDYEICKIKPPIALDGRTKKITTLGTNAEYNQYVKTGQASCLMGKY